MRIQIKTLKRKNYALEVQADDNIGVIKMKIQRQLGLALAQNMSLVYENKLLKNDWLPADAGMKDNDFVTLMHLVKKKPKFRMPEKAQTWLQMPPNGAAALKQNRMAKPGSLVPAAIAASASEKPSKEEIKSPPDKDQAGIDETIQKLMGMGYSKAKVLRAMKISNNVMNKAANYLLSTIPADEAAPPTEEKAAAAQPTKAKDSEETTAIPIQDKPVTEEAAQQKITTGNSGNTKINEEKEAAPDVDADQKQEVKAAGDSKGVDLTEAEKAVVETLANSLGFSHQQALEAFLVCDKNHMMAANYLFENPRKCSVPAAEVHAATQPKAQQPVNSAPQVLPPIQPVADEKQPTADQGNSAQAEALTGHKAEAKASQDDEDAPNEVPVDQSEAVPESIQAAQNDAECNATVASDGKDQENKDPIKVD